MFANNRFSNFLVWFEAEAFETGWDYQAIAFHLRTSIAPCLQEGLRIVAPTTSYAELKGALMQIDTQYWETEVECTLYVQPANKPFNTNTAQWTMFPDNNKTKPTPTKSPKVPPKPMPKDQQFPVPKDMPWDDSYPMSLDNSFPTLKDVLLDSNIDIKIIRAAPFARLIREGIDVYQLHISPVSPQETWCMEQTQNSEEKKTEQEILDKVVLPEYHDFANIFSEGEAKTLPPHWPYNHKINLEEGVEPPFRKIYNMSEMELKLLKDYIDDMLGKGFIWPSSSAAGAPVLSLWLCIDYHSLNQITKKNCYPIPLINDLINRLKDAKVYMKIDLWVGYNNICIAPGHEYKTAFRTHYGLFEYLVMPFRMTNSPATFQYSMNNIFHDMTNIFVIIYLNDILIFSKNLDEHKIHVQNVLEWLQEHNLHTKPEKCKFHTTSIEYLGIIITPEGVCMDPRKVQAILQWPEPRKVKELQSFLGFTNFYQWFINNYSGITKPLNSLLQGNTPWKWTEQCESVF